MADRGGYLDSGGAGLQQIDSDLQLLLQAVSRIADRIAPNPVSITGSRGGNVALENLLTALAGLGLVVDNTTP